MEDFEKFYNRALRFLSFRPRSEKEIKDYLRKSKKQKAKSKIKDETISLIVKKLKEHRFLDDEEFARWWIEQRTKIKPRAWRTIQFELKQKGIDDEIIQNSRLAGGRAEFRIQSDLESAKKLVEKRVSKYKNLPRQEIYQKLGRFLASKGFDWGTIKKTIDESLEEKV